MDPFRLQGGQGVTVELPPHGERLLPLADVLKLAGKPFPLVEQIGRLFQRLRSRPRFPRRNFAAVFLDQLLQLPRNPGRFGKLFRKLLSVLRGAAADCFNLHHAESAQCGERLILFGAQRQQRDLFHRYNHLISSPVDFTAGSARCRERDICNWSAHPHPSDRGRGACRC